MATTMTFCNMKKMEIIKKEINHLKSSKILLKRSKGTSALMNTLLMKGSLILSKQIHQMKKYKDRSTFKKIQIKTIKCRLASSASLMQSIKLKMISLSLLIRK